MAAAFEEWVALEIEKMALAGGHPHLLVLAAAVDEAEECEELRPCAESVLHRIGVTLGIGAQALEEAAHGVVFNEKALGREKRAILGEEHEDEAEEHGDEAAVNVLGVAGGEIVEALALGLLLGGDKAAQQLVKGVEHLLGELFGNGGLVAAAGLEQGGQALRRGRGE